MLEGLCVEQGKNSGFVDAAACSDDQQPYIHIIGQEEGTVVEMDETQVLDAATLLALLRHKRENVVAFEEEL